MHETTERAGGAAGIDDAFVEDIVGTGALPARARFSTDAPVHDLAGTWSFRYRAEGVDAGDEALADPDLDDAAWDRIPVPSHWALHGYGTPLYTTNRFPFPIDPPHVPDANPTGEYRRRFAWAGPAGAPAVLRLDGVDSAGTVWLNGVRLGTTRGSRLVHEFAVDGLLRAGDNVLAVRVTQWSATSYLEDQDMWWLAGLFRDVSLQETPAGGIDDLVVDADWDPATGAATLRVDARTRDGAPARVSLPELGVAGATGTALPVPGARAWSAEEPVLTDLLVSTAAETARLRVGFRRIAIEDAQLTVNGRRVLFRGVNRHEHHPDLGRIVPADLVRHELVLMKQHNVNAIRTAHYPPHPDLPALADELGLYLMVESDFETHGFQLADWRGNPSDDPRWEPAAVDRATRTVARDRNHPSVMMWSIGNESGVGRTLTAAARTMHRLDPGRPVHYEGDPTSADVDVFSRMYAHVDDVDAAGRFAEPALDDADLDARRRRQPFLLCEYAHAMGNGPGGLADYQRLFDRYPRCQGGFVWEWLEHGIRKRTADGRAYFGYGGDFGDRLHDGNYVADGLVDADRTPRPGLADVKAVFAPVQLALDPEGTAVTVTNRYETRHLDHVRLAWTRDGDAGGAAGDLEVPDLAPGEEVVLPLPAPDRPAGADTITSVRATLRTATPWAPAGHELAAAAVGGPAEPPAPEPAAPARQGPDGWELGPASFDGHGRLRRLGGTAVHGPELVLWRAPTDNDLGRSTLPWSVIPGPEPADAEAWAAAGLDRLESRVVDVRAEGGALVVETRVGAAGGDAVVDVRIAWTSDGRRVQLAVSAEPGGAHHPPTWARVGLRFELPWAADRIAWTGTGPGQAYPDTGSGQRLGRWSAGSALELHTDYVRPQENGSRPASRVDLRGPAGALRVRGAFAFTASPWTSEELGAAAHPVELPDPHRRTLLTLDLARHGVGTASCGPGVLPPYRLTPRAVAGRFVLDEAAD